ncbi:hypothetical protein [Crateriforma conspicua]|uniref:hypothetical protein n=1 Tax=Crateriforma conspicua TaxID=2527996 RepID=UPI00118A98CD|nr:hypothetical protein [Crateriforma conspicua]QDV62852.1 hypothetical protein Mal65_19890 [Crateriforma conspicua]
MSDHAIQSKPADDPAFQLPSLLQGLTFPLIIAGVLALIAGAALGHFGVNPTFGMSVYLTSVMYVLTIAVGALFFVLIQHLCKAGWSVVVRRVAELMMVMIIPLAVLFIPILVSFTGEGVLYKWDDPGYAAATGIDTTVWGEKSRWLTPGWFIVRTLIYFAIWGGLAVWYFRCSRTQDETGERTLTESMQGAAGPAIIAFAFVTSFAAFDWLMSLAPMWFSTMFGVYIFTGGILSAHCAIALFTFLLQRQGALRDEVTKEHYHDLGKLIFGFICFWGYISFSQYMLIWYGNIPEETHWFYERSQGPFLSISALLIVAHWAVPFLAIMSRHVRRRPALVALIGAYILVMHFIDIYWVVIPEADHAHEGLGVGGAVGVLASLVCVLGMVMLMVGLMLKVAGNTRLIAVRDPRLQESLAFHNI